MNRLRALLGFAAAVGPWGIALGCSCMSGTIQQQYQAADNVFVAVVTGCISEKFVRYGSCGNHGWVFKTVEDLKGSNAKIRRLSSDDNVDTLSSCDMSLEIGEKYLLYLYEGRTYLCGGSTEWSRGGASEADVLRAYRDKKVETITNPWYFYDRFGSCSLSHEMDGATIRFEYLYDPRDMVLSAPLPPKPVPVMLLNLSEPFKFEGPTRMQIGKDAVPLTRTRTISPDGQSEPLEVVPVNRTLDVIDQLSRADEMVITGTRSTAGGAVEPFEVTTPASLASSGIADFKSCVARHPECEKR